MIEVTYYRNLNRLVMEGHAGAGEVGQDLVCAAASMLAYTLAANVANMTDSGQVREPVMDMTDGDAVISCKPRHNLKAAVMLVFDSICAGFQLLSHDYPDFVKYEIRG